MKQPLSREVLLSLLGGMVLAAGLFLAWNTLASSGDARRVLERRLQDLAALRAEQKAFSSDDLAVRRYAALESTRAPNLAEWAGNAEGPGRVTIEEGPRRELQDGWRERTAEVTFEDRPFAEVEVFLSRAESARPPWRLTGLALQADDGAPGHGRAVLRLTVLEKP